MVYGTWKAVENFSSIFAKMCNKSRVSIKLSGFYGYNLHCLQRDRLLLSSLCYASLLISAIRSLFSHVFFWWRVLQPVLLLKFPLKKFQTVLRSPGTIFELLQHSTRLFVLRCFQPLFFWRSRWSPGFRAWHLPRVIFSFVMEHKQFTGHYDHAESGLK